MRLVRLAFNRGTSRGDRSPMVSFVPIPFSAGTLASRMSSKTTRSVVALAAK